MKTENVVTGGWSARFVARYRNARTVIAQIKAGEWRPKFNPYSKEHLTAERQGLELWIGNGPWFCEVRSGFLNPMRYREVSSHFGLFWRHYVWLAAARHLKQTADRGRVAATGVPIL